MVLRSRCCGTVTTVEGRTIPEYEMCSFYLKAADCRYCSHYDKKTNTCRLYGRKIRYYQGLCSKYDGPRPVPSLTR